MNNELSILADRVWDFITICLDEPESFSPAPGSALASHYDTEFNAMALVLFALQFNRNTAYRRICESRNVSPRSVAHWTEIPAVPAAAFKELDLTCLAPEDRTTVFHSSGTTQQRPSRHYHCPKSLALYEHALWPWFQIHALSQSFDPTGAASLDSTNRTIEFLPMVLTPPPSQAPHSSLVYMFDVIRKRMGAHDSSFLARTGSDGGWVLDAAAVVTRLHDASLRNEPVLLLGTAFSLVHLLDHLTENAISVALPPRSLVMETGGYKGRSREVGKSELHALIAARLGVGRTDIVSEYGMSELGSQAYPFGSFDIEPEQRPFRFPPWARVHVTSPETGRDVEPGQTGLIRVFDLANIFSVMAVQTEDLAVRREIGFELIGRRSDLEPRGCSLMSQSES